MDDDLNAILIPVEVAPDDCPVLPQLKNGNWLRLAHTAALWQVVLWRRQYPECQRINGGGICWRCSADVIVTHIAGEDAPNGYTVQPSAPTPEPSPTPREPAPLPLPPQRTRADTSGSSPDGNPPGPRWVAR